MSEPFRSIALAAACGLLLWSPAGDARDSVDHVPDGVFGAGIEGPAVGPDGALYAVDFGGRPEIGRVVGADGEGRAERFIALPEGSTGNGIRFGRDGTMYIADYTGHAILAVDMGTREVRVHAHEPRMHQPNDIAIASDDTLYASDPDWSTGSGQVWRIDPDGSTHRLAEGMGTTNGIELSPDGRHLYVNESVQRTIWRFEVREDGSLGGRTLFHRFEDHGLDGMRTDAAGNLHVTRFGAGRVAVISPDGALLGEVVLSGQRPTNLAFGGQDGRSVYVTLQDRGAIEVYRSEHPGRSWEMRADR